MDIFNIPLAPGLHVDYTETYPRTLRGVVTPSTPFKIGPDDAVYFPLGVIPDEIRKQRIADLRLVLRSRSFIQYADGDTVAASNRLTAQMLVEPYDADKLTSDLFLPTDSLARSEYMPQSLEWDTVDLSDFIKPLYVSDYATAFLRGLKLTGPTVGSSADSWPVIEIYPPGSAYAPYYELQCEPVQPEVLAPTPSGGWVDPDKALTLSWRFSAAETIDPIKQASALVEWQIDDGEIHQTSLSTAESYTLPASVLPASGAIKWRVTVTGDNGVSSEASNWLKLATTESKPVVTPVRPVGGFVEAAAATKFEWSYSIAAGAEPSAYELQYRAAGAAWTALISGTGAATSVSVDTTALPAGSMEWRVRAANGSGIWSDWSTPAQIVLISTPAAPAVTVTSGASPQPVITWQSSGQSGYQVRIGDFDSGLIYGTERSYQYKGFLPDGGTLIQVRIQNQYELWSDWGAYFVTVQNVPGSSELSLTVQAQPYADTLLLWSKVPNALSYIVYRDGAAVAECDSADTQYVDTLAIGDATYQVRAVLAGGNYVLSDTATVALHPVGVQIRALDAGDWIDVSHSLTSLPAITSSRTRAVSYYHYTGGVYPVPEVSPFEDMTYSLSVAFRRGDPAADAFDALLGHTVIVKDQYGNFMVGVLGTYSKTQNTFTVAYKATVSQIDRSAYEIDIL